MNNSFSIDSWRKKDRWRCLFMLAGHSRAKPIQMTPPARQNDVPDDMSTAGLTSKPTYVECASKRGLHHHQLHPILKYLPSHNEAGATLNLYLHKLRCVDSFLATRLPLPSHNSGLWPPEHPATALPSLVGHVIRRRIKKARDACYG